MAQPYDLTGIANLQTTLLQMLADQTSGAVKFAGGCETWVPSPTGWFNAILTAGASPTATTTNMVRIPIRDVRVTLDLLAGGTGLVAANAVQGVTPPSLLLETGRVPTGPNIAFGPLVNGATFVASTSYDLSGIAALQTTVNTMLADQQAGTTFFVGNAPFNAIYVPVTMAVQSTTLADALGRFRAMQAQFDLLDQ